MMGQQDLEGEVWRLEKVQQETKLGVGPGLWGCSLEQQELGVCGPLC